MKKIYEKLRKKYGTHIQVAYELGITERHYRAIRSGKVNLTQPMRKLMILLAYKK